MQYQRRSPYCPYNFIFKGSRKGESKLDKPRKLCKPMSYFDDTHLRHSLSFLGFCLSDHSRSFSLCHYDVLFRCLLVPHDLLVLLRTLDVTHLQNICPAIMHPNHATREGNILRRFSRLERPFQEKISRQE